MVQIGEQVQVRVLGGHGQAPETGTVAAILAPAREEESEIVELSSGIVGHICAQGLGVHYQKTAQEPAAVPMAAGILNASAGITFGDIPVSGAHLHGGCHVEVQRLDSQLLEYGRVFEVCDCSPGTQPIVQLSSGTFGAVTRMESPRLPSRTQCVHLLSAHPIVIATPLGASHTVLCQVTSILDSPSPDIILTGTITRSPSTTLSEDEITAALTAFLVPFTPNPTPASSATTTPEPGQFPALPSPAKSTPAPRPPPRWLPQEAHAAATPPRYSPSQQVPARVFAPPFEPSISASPHGSVSPRRSVGDSYNGIDSYRQPSRPGTPPPGVFSAAAPGTHAASLPAGRMPEAAEFPLGDLDAGVRSLAVGSLSQSGIVTELTRGAAASGSPAAGSSVPSPRGVSSSQVVGVEDVMATLWFDRPEDEAEWVARQKEEAIGPKLAVLHEQCQQLGLSSDRAETLMMLIEGATVPQVLDTLQRYTENFEAAANHLLNSVAANSGHDSSVPDDAGSPASWRDDSFQDLPVPTPATGADAAPSPPASSNARTLAATSDAWGGEGAPAKRKKKKGKGKALDGCFQAVPTPYGGAVVVAHRASHMGSLAAVVKSSQGSGPGPPPLKTKPNPLQPKQNKRAAVATSFDDSLPEFLLPFIAEHVRALEAANAQVVAGPAPRQQPEWTKVKPKRTPEGRAPRTAESLVTLQSVQFREQCLKELGLIAERTTERLRLLTLCSTAANQRRIYDKSAVHRLEDCTSWINRAKESIVKAHVIAARNTRLTNVPGMIDLHLMDRRTAEQVVLGCVHELQRNLQTGEVHIITGVGNHSHNNKANLKPLVLEIIAEADLEYSMMDRNPGMIIMHVKP